MTDKDFLGWVYQRLIWCHEEDPNVDYMRRLDSIIKNMPDDA